MIAVFENPIHADIPIPFHTAARAPDYWRHDIERYREFGDFFFFGSIDTALKLMYKANLGNIILDHRFKYCNYAKIHGSMVNKDFSILPPYDVKNNSNKYMSEFGMIFARPNSYQKIFDGGVYYYRDEIFNNLNDSVIIAKPKQIAEEYRCFVVNGKISSASMYRKFGRLNEVNVDSDKDLISSLQNMVKIFFEPTNNYVREDFLPKTLVLDICRVMLAPDRSIFKVLEANSINTSGFYLCDSNKIVEDLINDYSS